MIKYLKFDDTGIYVANVGTARSLPDGAMELPEGMTPREAASCYVVDGVLTQRPLSPFPDFHEGNWIVRDCVAGTQVEIFDMSGEEVLFDGDIDAEQDVHLSFPDAGQYEIHVFAPLPAFRTKTTIEVEGATEPAALPSE